MTKKLHIEFISINEKIQNIVQICLHCKFIFCLIYLNILCYKHEKSIFVHISAFDHL